MVDAPFDRRPRILDYFAPIADARASSDFAWPCHAFRVTVPIRRSRHLNVFDEVVLRLLDNARLEEKRLAEATCLDDSLVRLVCCRLRDLDMITEQNDIAPAGRVYLSEAEKESLEYEVRWVFQERLGGKILPVVYSGELRYEELAKWDDVGGVATLLKSHRRVALRLLRAQHDSAERAPTPTEVVWATKRHRDLGQQFALLRRGVAPCPPITRAAPLHIDPNPEAVYLRCAAVIPRSADDYRIADPFGYGFSPVLFRSYEAVRLRNPDEQRFIQNLRNRATTVRQGTSGASARTTEAEHALLEMFGAELRDHRELFEALRQAEQDYWTSQRPAKSGDQQAHLRYHAQQAAQGLAEAVEAALAFVATRSRRATSEELLTSGGRSPAQNDDLLEKFACRLGLRTDDIGSLLHVAAGRVRALREGDVDLQALIAVSLASAVEDEAHALRKLASVFPRWLPFLARLKRMRDGGAHGDCASARAGELVELRDMTHRSLPLLLPHLSRARAEPSPSFAPSSTSRIHDVRRLAISRLEEHFGVQTFAGLSAGAADILIQIEIAAARWAGVNDGEPKNVIRTINDLASVLQTLTHDRQPSCGDVPAPVGPPREAAAERAAEAGLLAANAELPVQLATVNPRRLDEAMRGLSPSLGATVMSLLLLAPIEWLRDLATASPNFLKICGRMVDLRGHGNRPLFMTIDDALALKSDVYSACAALMET